jgi:hypothetical protein
MPPWSERTGSCHAREGDAASLDGIEATVGRRKAKLLPLRVDSVVGTQKDAQGISVTAKTSCLQPFHTRPIAASGSILGGSTLGGRVGCTKRFLCVVSTPQALTWERFLLTCNGLSLYTAAPKNEIIVYLDQTHSCPVGWILTCWPGRRH